MARKKVILAYIANDSSRRATYKKRKRGLLKKIEELSILCGVKACAIIYGQCDSTPEVWPSSEAAEQVVRKLKAMPEIEQGKKMMNQEGFIKQRIAKMNEQLKKHERENREMEMNVLLVQCLGGKCLNDLKSEDLSELSWHIEAKIKALKDRINKINGSKRTVFAKEEKDEEYSRLELAMETLQRQPWFMDVINPQEAIMSSTIGDEMAYHFTDNNAWLDALFP